MDAPAEKYEPVLLGQHKKTRGRSRRSSQHTHVQHAHTHTHRGGKTWDCTPPFITAELTEDVFEEAVGFSTRQYVHESLFNDAAYGKLAMAKLTLEVTCRFFR